MKEVVYKEREGVYFVKPDGSFWFRIEDSKTVYDRLELGGNDGIHKMERKQNGGHKAIHKINS
jgi:hypothetical protein